MGWIHEFSVPVLSSGNSCFDSWLSKCSAGNSCILFIMGDADVPVTVGGGALPTGGTPSFINVKPLISIGSPTISLSSELRLNDVPVCIARLTIFISNRSNLLHLNGTCLALIIECFWARGIPTFMIAIWPLVIGWSRLPQTWPCPIPPFAWAPH